MSFPFGNIFPLAPFLTAFSRVRGREFTNVYLDARSSLPVLVPICFHSVDRMIGVPDRCMPPHSWNVFAFALFLEPVLTMSTPFFARVFLNEAQDHSCLDYFFPRSVSPVLLGSRSSCTPHSWDSIYISQSLAAFRGLATQFVHPRSRR